MQGVASQIAIQNANQWEWDVLRRERLRELSKRRQQNNNTESSNTKQKEQQQQNEQAQQSQQGGFKPTYSATQSSQNKSINLHPFFLNDDDSNTDPNQFLQPIEVQNMGWNTQTKNWINEGSTGNQQRRINNRNEILARSKYNVDLQLQRKRNIAENSRNGDMGFYYAPYEDAVKEYEKEKQWYINTDPRVLEAKRKYEQIKSGEQPEGYFDRVLYALGQISTLDVHGVVNGIQSIFAGNKSKKQDLLNDAYNVWMQRKNETQIATSNGKLQIADQISNVLDSSSIDRYVDVCNQLIADTDRRNILIDKYTSRTGQGITREESLELDMLKNRINTLTKEKDEFEKNIESAGTYESNTLLGAAISNAQEYLTSGGGSFNFDFGTGLGGSLLGFRENITKLQKGLATRNPQMVEEARQNLKRIRGAYENQSQKMKNLWRKDIERDTKDLNSYTSKYTVSDYFLNKEQEANQILNPFNPKKLWMAPGLLGASLSDTNKTAVSTATGLLTMLPIGRAARVGLQAVNYVSQVAQGADENFANVDQAYKEIVRSSLTEQGQYRTFLQDGREAIGNPAATDEDIINAYFRGDYIPKDIKVRKTLMNATTGSMKQFMQGQGVNLLDSWIDMAIETTPVGKFAKLSKIEAVKGAKQGLANIGESLAGTKAGQFVTSAIKNSKGKATQLVDKMVEYGVRRTANVSQIAKEMPKRLLQTRYNLGVANRAVKDIAKRSVIGAYSEAVEEGLQQEQQYERMHNPSDQYYDVYKQIPNTILGGPRLWYSLLFKDPDKASQEEQEIWQSMAGGILGSFVQGGSMNTVRTGVDAVQQMKDGDIILNNIVADKISGDTQIEKAKLYSKKLRTQRGKQNLIDVLDQYQQYNDKLNQSYKDGGVKQGIPEEWIAEDKAMVQDIENIRYSQKTQQLANRLGIKNKKFNLIDNDDYDLLVAMLYRNQQQIKEDNDSLSEVVRNQEKQTPITFNQFLENQVSAGNLDQNFLQSYIGEQNGITSLVNTENLSEEELNNVQKKHQELQDRYNNYISNINTIAKLAANMKTLQEIKALDKLNGRQSFIQKRVEREVNKIKQNINKIYEQQGKQAPKMDTLSDVEDFYKKAGLPISEDYINNIKTIDEYKLQRDLSIEKAYKFITDPKYAKKQLSQYKETKKQDEYLQQQVESDYYDKVLHDYAVQDAEINDNNNIYVGEDGKTYAVRLNVAKDENGEDVEYYSKHLYDPKTDVMDRSELPFNKEEWFDGRDQIDDMTQIKSPQLRENDGSEERVEEFSKRRDVIKQKQKYTRDLLNDKSRNGYTSRANRIESFVDENYSPYKRGKQYFLKNGEEELEITKTEYNYAKWYKKNYYTEQQEETQDDVQTEGEPEQSQQGQQDQKEGQKVPDIKMTDAQKNVIQDLSQFKVEGNKKIRYDLRSPMDYFIEDEDGNIQAYPRVHSKLKKMFELDHTVYDNMNSIFEELEKYRLDFIDAFKHRNDNQDAADKYKKSKISYINKIKQLQQEYNESLLKTVKNNENLYDFYNVILDGYYSNDNILMSKSTTDHISKIVGNRIGDNVQLPATSVISGTIADEICRRCFSGEDVKNEPRFKMDDSTFEQLKQDITDVKSDFESKGWVLLPQQYCWYTELEGIGRIAGETDMLAVDTDGSVYLIDFKTSKRSYKYGTQVKISGEKLITQPSDYVEAIDWNFAKSNFSARDEYRTQFTLYSMMIQQCTMQRQKVKTINILGFTVKASVSDNDLVQIKSIEKPNFIELEIQDDLNTYLIFDEDSQNTIRKEKENYLTLINHIENQLQSDKNYLNQHFDEINKSSNLYRELEQLSTRTKDIKSRINKIDINKDPVSELKNIHDQYLQLSTDYSNAVQKVQDYLSQKAEQYQQEQTPTVSTQSIPVDIQWDFKEIEKYDRVWYINISRQNEKLRQFRRITTNKDFIENTTFYLDTNIKTLMNHDYMITFEKIVYHTKDQNGNDVQFVLEGDDARSVSIYFAKYDQDGRPYGYGQNPLVKQIKEALQQNEENIKNKNFQLVLTGLSRTNGVIISLKENKNVKDTFDFTEEQIEHLLENGTDRVGVTDKMGVVKTIDKANKTIYGDGIYANSGERRLSPGQVVLIHDLKYNEDKGNGNHKIPIVLLQKKITNADADLIINLLKDTSKQELAVTNSGIVGPITKYQLLSTLVRFGRGAQNTGNDFVFRYKEIDGVAQRDVVELQIRDEEGQLITTEYDLNNPVSVGQLKRRLVEDVYLYTNNISVLNKATNKARNTDKNNVFSQLQEFFENNPNINEISYGESMVFNRADVDPDGDGSYKGITGLHWMIRHGWLTTNYGGVTDSIFSATGVQGIIPNKQQQNIEQQPEPEKVENVDVQPEQNVGGNIGYEKEDVEDVSIDDVNELLGGDFVADNEGLFHKQKGKANVKMEENVARRTIKRIVGDSIPLQMIDDIISVMYDGDVVGMCTAASIYISRQAEAGTDYHESFHAVVELLMDKNKRESLYKFTKNKFNMQNATDEEVAEALADLFFLYSKDAIHFEGRIGRLFSYVKDWINAFKVTKSLRLANLFVNADFGKFANKTISKEQVNDFKNRFPKGLNLKIKGKNGNGVELKHIYTSTQLDDAINYLVYLIIKNEGISSIGSNLDKLDISKEHLTNTKLDENNKPLSNFGRTYRIVTMSGKSEQELDDLVKEGKITPLVKNNVLIMREIFNNYEDIKPMILTKLKSMGVNSRLDQEQTERENKEGDDVSQISRDVDSHADEFYTHSMSDDLSSNMIFFLSTRPALRYATQEDVNNGIVQSLYKKDRNGNEQRVLVSSSKNSMGMTTFLDYKQVHQLLLSNLHDVKDVEDLYNKLKKLGKNDYLYENIARSLYQFRFQSYKRYTNRKDGMDNVPMVMFRGKLLDPKHYISNKNKLSQEDLYPKFVRWSHDILDKNGKIIFKAGDVIQGASIVMNYDMENLTTQLFQSIKSQKLDYNFLYIRSVVDDNGKVINGNYLYSYHPTNYDRSQQQYPIQWFDNLRSSFSGLFTKSGDLNKNFTNFKDSKKYLSELYNALTLAKANNGKITINKVNYDLTKGSDLSVVISQFVKSMRNIGVDIDTNMVQYLLQQMNPDEPMLYLAFVDLITKGGNNSVYSILQLIKDNGILDLMQNRLEAGDISFFTKDQPKNNRIHDSINTGSYVYTKSGFLTLLAMWQGKFRTSTTELMTIGPENTKMYTFAQNHTASDTIYDLNNSYDENGNLVKGCTLEELSQVDYVLARDQQGNRIGSVIGKTLINKDWNPNHNKLQLRTSAGTKSSTYSDEGSKYSKTTSREDYMAKVQMLLQGDIIFPALSDKSTYFSISGIKLPGLNFDNSSSSIGSLPVFNSNTGTMMFIHNVMENSNDKIRSIEDNPKSGYRYNDVLDQFIEYFTCENINVNKTINDLGLQEQNATNTPISENQKITNYHKGSINGARYLSLMGIYALEDMEIKVNGKTKSYKKGDYIPFNFKADTPSEGILEGRDLAQALFFDQPIEKQRVIVAEILRRRLDDTLNDLLEMGIISKNDNASKAKGVVTHDYYSYKNNYFDVDKINRLARCYSNIEGIQTFGNSALESLGVVAMAYDIMCKSMVSMEETRRFFTGMPQFFKTKYSSEGNLVDYGTDETKRYGGEGSTGSNNREDMANIPEEYTCAELKDWEISSAISESLEQAFKEGEYRESLSVYYSENPSLGKPSDAYNMSIEDVEKELEKTGMLEMINMKIKKESNSYKSEINVTDGTAYITDTMAENLLRMRGAFNNEIAEAFERLRGDKGYLNSAQDYRLIHEALISTQKYSAFGYRMQNGIPVHFYDKFALFPMFKGISFGFSRDLYDKMRKEGVDMVMFNSAVKSGSQGAQKFSPDMTKEDLQKFTFKNNIYKQKYKYIRRQLNTDPRTDEVMAAGTQAMKVSLSVLRDWQTYSIQNPDGTEQTLNKNEVLSAIMDKMNRMAEIGSQQIKEEFFTDGKLDYAKLKDFIVRELSSRNADKNILEAVNLDYLTDENRNIIPESVRFVTDINVVSNMAWIESILISHINKKVIDINFKGNAFYQRSVFGLDSPTVLNDDQVKYEMNGGKPLQMINEEGSMDAVISIDYFMDIIPKKYRYNFKKAKQWLIDNDIISGVKTGTKEWNNAKASTLSYRIPTQAASSIHALRFVDVLPIVRDTIILPREFTKITGSDFDIDKLYLSSFYYNVNKETGKASLIMDDEYENTANQLLSIYLSLIKDAGKQVTDGKISKSRYMHILNRSIDNDTELITNVLSDIESGKTKKTVEPYQFENLTNQVKIKQSFATGKLGIGPFALNNNNQVLTMLYNVSFKDFGDDDKSLLTYIGMNRLDRVTDINGNHILSWISAMINAHVDVAKDPYILRLNVNKFTYNLVNLLIRCGLGDRALYFINNPIIKDLARISEETQGRIVDEPEISVRKRFENAQEQYIRDCKFRDESFSKLYMKAVSSEKRAAEKKDFDKIAEIMGMSQHGRTINSIKIFKDGQYYTVDGTYIMRDILKNKDVLIDENKPLSIDNLRDDDQFYYVLEGDRRVTPKEVQMYIFLAMQNLNINAAALSAVVQATKVDTKKHGKTVREQSEYNAKYEQLLGGEISDMFENLDNMLTKSYINVKTNLGIGIPKKILQEFSITATDNFRYVVDSICSMYLNNQSSKAKTSIQNAVLAYVKQIAMNKAMEDNGITSEKWMEMIQGRKTLAQRITNLQNILISDVDGKYKSLATNGTIINPLLANLRRIPYQPQYGQVHYDLIGLENKGADDSELSNNYIDAWQQLLDYDDPQYPKESEAIRKLASDLAVYAFMTSSDTKGTNKFFKYVPVSWRNDFGYSEYIRQAFQYFKDGNVKVQEDAEDGFLTIDPYELIMNNYMDPNILPTHKMNKFMGSSYQYSETDFQGKIITSNIYTMIAGLVNDRPTIKTSNYITQYPPFVRIQRPNTNRFSADQYLLYRLAAYGTKTLSNGKQVSYPVYILLNPKGQRVKIGAQNYDFYSVGRDDNYQHGFLKGETPNFLEKIKWIQKNIEKIQELRAAKTATVGDVRQLFDIPVGDSYSIQTFGNIQRTVYQNEKYGNIGEDIEEAEIHPEQTLNTLSNMKFEWARTSDNGFEVSTAANKNGLVGDPQFSAFNAKFKQGTIIEGVDVSGRSIEDVYQHIIKKSEKGKAPSKDSKIYIDSKNFGTTFKGFNKEVIRVEYGADDIVPRIIFKSPSGQIGLLSFKNGRWGVSRRQKSPNGDMVFYSETMSKENVQKFIDRYVPKKFQEYINSEKIYDDNKADAKDNKGRVSAFFRDNYNIHFINEYFIGTGKSHESFEDFSYYEGYLPLWQEWARQNPQLIDQLIEKASGKVLTDRFANTRVNQARALSDILNETQNTETNVKNGTAAFNINKALDTYTLHSGGAKGSDSYWGTAGEKYGLLYDDKHQRHYYHQEKTPVGNVEISNQDYEEGRYKAAQAASARWGYDLKTMKDNRLIRNWAQVKYSDAIFAIGTLVKPGQSIDPNNNKETRIAKKVIVSGGTGYAVEMAIQAGKPVYVFDQRRNRWYKNVDGKWSKSDIPVLTKNFAGIGTRELQDNGKQAIEDVYKKTIEQMQKNSTNQDIDINIEDFSNLNEQRREQCD